MPGVQDSGGNQRYPPEGHVGAGNQRGPAPRRLTSPASFNPSAVCAGRFVETPRCFSRGGALARTLGSSASPRGYPSPGRDPRKASAGAGSPSPIGRSARLHSRTALPTLPLCSSEGDFRPSTFAILRIACYLPWRLASCFWMFCSITCSTHPIKRSRHGASKE